METGQERNLANELLEWLTARSIGLEMLYHIGVLSEGTLIDRIDNEMVWLFSDIVKILDDDSLDDPTCFHRIDAIVRVFQEKGFGISRHDW